MVTEADTCRKYVLSKLYDAGWGGDQIAREHYYRRDIQYTPGRIILRGEQVRWRAGCKVDYSLCYAGFPISVVEAKAEGEPSDQGCVCSMEKGMI